jgi:hypothetical protein
MMTGIGIADRRTDGADDGYARARMGGDGEKERERGKGKRRRAEHDERKEGRIRARVWSLKRCVGISFSVSFVLEVAAGGEALHAREGAGAAVYG